MTLVSRSRWERRARVFFCFRHHKVVVSRVAPVLLGLEKVGSRVVSVKGENSENV